MKAVLDTNMVIYLQKGLLAEKLPIGEYFISAITEMELLSFGGLSDLQRQWLQRFIDAIEVIEINNEVKKVTIDLRCKYHLKLPDAIVAASAINKDAILFSNDKKLQNISELRIKFIALLLNNHN